MADLLIELLSEEIPAGLQAPAAENLKKLMTNGMVEAGLTYASAAAFHTPRRLTLAVEGLLDSSPTVQEERKGPKVGAPEKAIQGFLRGAGLTPGDLETRDDKKGQVYFAKITKPGRPAAEIVAEVLEATIRNFPWPKSMRWGTGSLRWVRPLRASQRILVGDFIGLQRPAAQAKSGWVINLRHRFRACRRCLLAACRRRKTAAPLDFHREYLRPRQKFRPA